MDPDCRLYKKVLGDAAQLTYLGHVLMDHRHGLIAGEQVTTADGIAEGGASTFGPRFFEKIRCLADFIVEYVRSLSGNNLCSALP